MRFSSVSFAAALASLAAALASCPAASMDVELAKSFAYALMASGTAAHHCGGLMQDEARLAAMEKAAGLSKPDMAWLLQQFQAIDQQIRKDIAEQGLPKWCALMRQRLGPEHGLGVLRQQARNGN